MKANIWLDIFEFTLLVYAMPKKKVYSLILSENNIKSVQKCWKKFG